MPALGNGNIPFDTLFWMTIDIRQSRMSVLPVGPPRDLPYMTWREYHELTKHSVESLRRTQHYLDWTNMPNPFRHYGGVPVVDLPADPPAPQISALKVLEGKTGNTLARDGAEFLSQLMFYSASISASKRVPSTGAIYSLRVNPSSGNLHPTEFHFCTRGLVIQGPRLSVLLTRHRTCLAGSYACGSISRKRELCYWTFFG